MLTGGERRRAATRSKWQSSVPEHVLQLYLKRKGMDNAESQKRGTKWNFKVGDGKQRKVYGSGIKRGRDTDRYVIAHGKSSAIQN